MAEPTKGELLRLARYVACPGSSALLLRETERGKKVTDGWCSIQEAISEVRSFSVAVADDVLAVDGDDVDSAEKAADLASACMR